MRYDTIRTCRIDRLFFADDLALPPLSERGLQNAVDQVIAVCKN